MTAPGLAARPEPWRLSLSDLLAGIAERDGRRCVRCGAGVAGGHRSAHHRVLGDRSVNQPWNLLTLCGSGTTLCHAWVHGVAVAGYPPPDRNQVRWAGWIVSRHHGHPWLVPVYYDQPGHRTGWFLLADDLGLTPYDQPGQEAPAP